MERPASSTLPTTPGIYIYKDAQGRIIYVGKPETSASASFPISGTLRP